jgi:hypothetical protein
MTTSTTVACPRTLSADDFFTGFFAALAARGAQTVARRGPDFDRSLASAFTIFRDASRALGLSVTFYVRPHPVYQDSITVRDGIASAVRRGLISLDNPTFQRIRLKINPDEGRSILEDMPGGGELYVRLASNFLSEYRCARVV